MTTQDKLRDIKTQLRILSSNLGLTKDDFEDAGYDHVEKAQDFVDHAIRSIEDAIGVTA